jgi:hypothetical protein
MGTPFPNPVVGGGGALVVPVIRSPNFSLEDQTGWAVYANGDAYFFNVTASGEVSANSVIVDGEGDGVFVYDGAPGPNTLIVSIASQAGTDGYGNPYSGPGISVSAPGPDGGKNEIQVRPDKNAILIYAA